MSNVPDPSHPAHPTDFRTDPPSGSVPVPRRRRGNPRWVNPSALQNSPVEPSEWDKMLARLGLRNDAAALAEIQRGGEKGRELARWVRQNRSRFAPEAVMKELNIELETYYGV